MNATVIEMDKQGICKSNFNEEDFEKLYKTWTKVYVTVTKADMQKIINKLGEDNFEGISKSGVDNARIEERVDFKHIWQHLL